jgi:hypothetical protein
MQQSIKKQSFYCTSAVDIEHLGQNYQSKKYLLESLDLNYLHFFRRREKIANTTVE